MEKLTQHCQKTETTAWFQNRAGNRHHDGGLEDCKEQLQTRAALQVTMNKYDPTCVNKSHEYKRETELTGECCLVFLFIWFCFSLFACKTLLG